MQNLMNQEMKGKTSQEYLWNAKLVTLSSVNLCVYFLIVPTISLHYPFLSLSLNTPVDLAPRGNLPGAMFTLLCLPQLVYQPFFYRLLLDGVGIQANFLTKIWSHPL